MTANIQFEIEDLMTTHSRRYRGTAMGPWSNGEKQMLEDSAHLVDKLCRRVHNLKTVSEDVGIDLGLEVLEDNPDWDKVESRIRDLETLNGQ